MMLQLLLILLPLIPGTDAAAIHLQKGDQAYRDFRTRDAITYYAKAFEVEPRNYDVLIRLSRSWNDLGRLTLRRSDSSEVCYRNGLDFARQLVEAYPDSAASWFMLALCHGSLTPFKSLGEKLDIAQDVEKNALRSLEIDPEYSMPFVLLGIYYRSVSRLSWMERTIVNGILGKDIYGTIEDSERNLLKALELEPANSYAYYELSMTYRAMDKNDEAEKALRKVLEFEPTNERERQQFMSAQRRLERMISADDRNASPSQRSDR